MNDRFPNHFDQADTKIPGGRFALLLGSLTLVAFGAIAAWSTADASRRHWIESTEIAVMPAPEEEKFFPIPTSLVPGTVLATMDRRPLYLVSAGALAFDDEIVVGIGLEDTRVYPIYEVKSPEQRPSPLLLKISPGSYLPVTTDKNFKSWNPS